MTTFYEVQTKDLGRWRGETGGRFVVGKDHPTDTDAREAAVGYADGIAGGLPVRVVRVEAEIVHTAGGGQ